MLALIVNEQIVTVQHDVHVVTQKNLNDVLASHVLVKIVVVQNDVTVVQNKKDLMRGLSTKIRTNYIRICSKKSISSHTIGVYIFLFYYDTIKSNII